MTQRRSAEPEDRPAPPTLAPAIELEPTTTPNAGTPATPHCSVCSPPPLSNPQETPGSEGSRQQDSPPGQEKDAPEEETERDLDRKEEGASVRDEEDKTPVTEEDRKQEESVVSLDTAEIAAIEADRDLDEKEEGACVRYEEEDKTPVTEEDRKQEESVVSLDTAEVAAIEANRDLDEKEEDACVRDEEADKTPATEEDRKQEESVVSLGAAEVAAIEAAVRLASILVAEEPNNDVDGVTAADCHQEASDKVLRLRYPQFNELLEFSLVEETLKVVVGVPESVRASLVKVRYSSNEWVTIRRASGQVCFKPGKGGRVMAKFSIPWPTDGEFEEFGVSVNLLSNANEWEFCMVTTLRVCGSPCNCVLLDDFRYRMQGR